MDRADLFHGHIGGIDTLAKSLLVAEALLEDGTLERARTDRYAGWDGELGSQLSSESATLDSIANEATTASLSPTPVSGQQEWLENQVNRVIWSEGCEKP